MKMALIHAATSATIFRVYNAANVKFFADRHGMPFYIGMSESKFYAAQRALRGR
jgi:hypothetical protein